jgi:phosphatidylserine/phosphatidylglycerophosphate/cardiolipin synthase-like enzyme
MAAVSGNGSSKGLPTTTPAQGPAALIGKADLSVTDLDVFKAAPPPAGYPTTVRTFYSPEDYVPQALQSVISSVQRSIVVAMYGFDDDVLAGMLAKALADPGIYVQITLDKSQAAGTTEAALLKKYFNGGVGNSIAIGHSERGAIMHRKMVIVDGIWRISGSTNWSTSGETLQDNELTIMRDAVVCAEARPILDVEHDAALKQMAAARNAPAPAKTKAAQKKAAPKPPGKKAAKKPAAKKPAAKKPAKKKAVR